MQVIIIGAGISGLSAAIALKQTLPSIRIEVYEIRPSPSTIGGAVNLTPNALRYLSSLKVLPRLENTACSVRSIEILSCRTGSKLAELSFDIPGSDGFQALRARRSELLAALTDTWLTDFGGDIIYDAKLSSIETASSGSVEAKFTVKGAPVTRTADLLLGCDGIHSFVRTSFVEPDRGEIYSGIATAYGITSLSEEEEDEKQNLPFDATAVFSSRRGSLLMSYANPEKTTLYMAAVMETQEISSREGWKVKGSDQDAVKNEILARFCRTGPLADKLKKVVDRLDDWFLYPVYKLSPGGVWSKDKVLLLGDAAHAMPPQGESTGFAIEDAMLFARIMNDAINRPEESSQSGPGSVDVEAVFTRYERNRRARIDAAYTEANMRWESVKDTGWLASVMREWMIWLFLWFTRSSREKNFAFDVKTVNLAD